MYGGVEGAEPRGFPLSRLRHRLTFWKWSQTASSNATADSTINWAEGMAPSAVNDSARAMMAAVAKYRDDVAGGIVTTGSSTAYAVSTWQGFDTLAHLNGQMIACVPHTTSGATVTLKVDSLGAKPLRASPNVELQGGTLVQGTPYVATYNNSDGAFYLQGFAGNTYQIPLGGRPMSDRARPTRPLRSPTGRRSRAAPMPRCSRWSRPRLAPATARPRSTCRTCAAS
jgi:hypothetical protein